MKFQVNGRDIDANDVRVMVPFEHDGQGYTLVVILGADGCEAYAVDDLGLVQDITSTDYSSLIDQFADDCSR